MKLHTKLYRHLISLIARGRGNDKVLKEVLRMKEERENHYEEWKIAVDEFTLYLDMEPISDDQKKRLWLESFEPGEAVSFIIEKRKKNGREN